MWETDHWHKESGSREMNFRFDVWTRVARWFVFKPKIQILVKFGGPLNRKCCYICYICYILFLLEYCTAIWYNLQPFGRVCGHLLCIFFRFWYVCTEQKSGNPGLNFWKLAEPGFFHCLACPICRKDWR
jgi:hypothetical protein